MPDYMPLSEDVDVKEIAHDAPGLNGAGMLLFSFIGSAIKNKDM
jgi:hypothetical protein